MILVKVTTDARTGQLVQHLRTSEGARLRVFGEIDISVQQTYALAQFGRDVMVSRVQRGIGSDDHVMPGLSRGYAIQKTRAGRGNIRDLTFSGSMLNSIQVRSVSATDARIDITDSLNRIKADANERRSPWWGWSPNDLEQISAAGNAVFRSVSAGVTGGFGGARSPLSIGISGQSTVPAALAGSGRLAA